MLQVSERLRRQMIADAAYYRAERRGFRGGDPVADWLAAERQVDAALETQEDTLCLLEERLAWTNQRLMAFRRGLAYMMGQARSERQAEVDKLGRLRDELERTIKHIERQGVYAEETAKQQAEGTWNDINDVIERLSPRKPRRFPTIQAAQSDPPHASSQTTAGIARAAGPSGAGAA